MLPGITDTWTNLRLEKSVSRFWRSNSWVKLRPERSDLRPERANLRHECLNSNRRGLILIKKQGRIHDNPVVDGWAGAVMPKLVRIQKCDERT